MIMEQPPGFAKDKEHLVCRLRKVLCDLKQAHTAGTLGYMTILCSMACEISFRDKPLSCVKARDSQYAVVVLYVGDMNVTGSHAQVVDNLRAYIKKTIKMTDIGLLHYFLGLGVEVQQKRQCIYFPNKLY